jgi:pullulanase
MPTFGEVQQNLTFLNTGPSQIPGVIMMKLDANSGHYGPYKHILVIFNATNQPLTFTDGSLQGLHLHLHPVQQNSNDALTRQSTFDRKEGVATVAGLTTAVFVSEAE